MSSAIVSRGIQQYSNDEVTSILNTADFWLDMSDTSKFTTLSTTRIGTITDKSVTPKTITKTGDISYDTLRKGIRGSTGASDFLTISLAAPSGATGTETIFVACYTSNSGISSFIGGTGSGTRAYSMSTSAFQYGPYGGTTLSTTGTIPSETMVVGCARLTNGTSANLYYNGRLTASGTIGANGASATQNIFRSGGVSTYWLRGGIYEMIIFSTALTTTQINIVNHYLMNKWKIVTSTTSLISSPLSITSSPCTLWLDGNDPSTITYGTGTAVAQWSDKSGNGFHATQATASKRPTYDSTLKGLKFTGANLTCFNTTCPFSPTETIFFVANVDPSTSSNILIGTTNANYGRYFSIRTGTAVLYSNLTALSTATYNSLNTTDKYLIHWINDGTNGFFEIGYNTVQDKDSITAFTYQAGTFNNVIGGTTSTGGGNTYNSYIYEIIIFNSGLSAADRRSICQYLTNKWGITNNAPRTDTYLYPFYNSRPFTRPFNPLDFDGCALWLDASDTTTITLSGSSVTQWSDKSPNNYNATTFNASPTYTTNAINFSGTQGLTTSLTASSNIESGFFVFASTDMTALNTLVGGASSSGGRQFRAPGDLQTIKQAVSALLFGGSPALTNNVKYLAEYVNDGVTLTHYLNGSVHKSGSPTTYTAGILTSIGLIVGANEGFKGYINEMILYNRALSTAERQQIESYLAQKWGLVNSLQGVTSSFTPTSYSNCALWLDGSDASTITFATGSKVSQWNDKSGNNRHATQPTAANQPTYTLNAQNGLNSLTFTNPTYNANFMTLPSFIPSSSNQISVFVVINCTTSDILNGGDFFLNTADYTVFTLTTYNNNYTVYIYNGSNLLTGYQPRDKTSILEVTYNGTTTTPYVNGTAYTTRNDSGTGLTTAKTLTLGGGQWNWVISEVIWYSTLLTTNQRQQVEAYLSNKWGVTLSTSATIHPGRLYNSLTTPFDPRDLRSCVLWVDAADSTTVQLTGAGGTVGGVLDKSGNGNNLTGGTGFTYNQTKFNNIYPSFFSSTSTSTSIVGSTGTVSFVQPLTIIVLSSSPYTGAGNSFVFDSNSINSTIQLFYLYSGAQSGRIRTVNASSQTGVITYSTTTGSPQIGCFLVNGASSLAVINGTNATGGQPLGAGTLNVFNLGSDRLKTSCLQGHICEVIFYNRIITTAERQRVEGYLAHKWGLTANLPSTHPFKKIAP